MRRRQGSLVRRVLSRTALLCLTCSPIALAGGLQVLESAAAVGSFGLRVEVAPTCASEDVVVPPGTVNTDYVACKTITAGGVEVISPGAKFVAGDKIILQDEFLVAFGAPFSTTVNDLVNSPFAYVRNDRPTAEEVYTAKFHLRLDLLTLAVGDEIEHFAGYSADGNLQFKVVLRRNASPDENRLAIVAREDGGSFV